MTKRNDWTTTLIATALCAILSATAGAAEKPKLKGLIIAGGCCHDYATQNKILAQGISQRVSIAWDVVFEGKKRGDKVSIYKKKDWIEGYDVVLHNECYGGVTDVKFVESIAAAHAKGVPAVVIHCSLHSYRNAKTDEWRKLLGVTSRSHERGGRTIPIKTLAKDHPIMTDFPDGWEAPRVELYKIEKTWPKTTPLAQAYGRDTKKDHTCIWTNEFGKARVFGTSLGHDNETMKKHVYLDVVSRGLLWACGKLNDDGTPAAGYKGTGVGPLPVDKPKGPTGEPTPVKRR